MRCARRRHLQESWSRRNAGPSTRSSRRNGPASRDPRQLEHIIRAAGTIADDNDVVVIGSQAILGEFPNAPAELLVSNEADVYPRAHTERSDLIDGTIGEGSPFQREFGYYAHGDETTAV